MRKFKLIKEYPGSPDLGTEVEKESNSKSSSSYFYRSGDRRICVFNHHVEESPEYWEEVNQNAWYVVSNRDYQYNWTLFQEWTVYFINTSYPQVRDENLNYFKTMEEAKNFILYNRPCLSLAEVQKMIGPSDNYETLSMYIKKNKL
jgi:hypothetical protein